MDPWLANVYGTGGADDLEKTAQHHLLMKLAEEEGVDLSGLDDEQLEQLSAEVLGDEETDQVYADDGSEGQEYVDPEEQEAYLAKEAQAKFEEADFLGRVMAHSYTAELEKIGGARFDAAKKSVGAFAGRAKARGAAIGRRGGELLAGGKKGTEGGMSGKRPGNSLKGFKKSEGMRGEAYKSLGARAGAAGAVGAAGYGAKKKFEKKASAFEKLAEMRAMEILQHNGIDPSTGGAMEEDEGTDEQFGQAVDGRALEILNENGYDTSGIE